MKRRVLNLLTALSLLLCVAVVALWVRSHSHWDSVGRYPYRRETRTYHQQAFSSCWGTLWVMWNEQKVLNRGLAAHLDSNDPPAGQDEDWHYEDSPADVVRLGTTRLERLGFWFRRTKNVKTAAGLDDKFSAALPHWVLAVLLAVPPARLSIRFLRQRRRVRFGHCSCCGYDLRGSPEKYPECGTVPGTAA